VGRETKKQTHCDLELKITKRSQIIEELRGFFARGTPVTPTVAQQKGRNKPTEALEIVRKALRTARMRLAGDYINEPKLSRKSETFLLVVVECSPTLASQLSQIEARQPRRSTSPIRREWGRNCRNKAIEVPI